MKIYISNYRNHWLSPYTILEKFFFWKRDYDAFDNHPPQWLNTVCEILQKFLDIIHPRINYIKIDKYDTWNADATLSEIIAPMLKQLKKNSYSSPLTEICDVPEELHPINTNDLWTDETVHERWQYILDEIIWAFESIADEDDLYYTLGQEKYDEHNERINNGLRLFGKYYRSMWE